MSEASADVAMATLSVDGVVSFVSMGAAAASSSSGSTAPVETTAAADAGKSPSPEKDVSPEPEARMVDSTLWQENALRLDHAEVWGSWYDPTTKGWGYACCKDKFRDQPCQAVKRKSAEAKAEGLAKRAAAGMSSGEEQTSSDSEPEAKEADPLDWKAPPPMLLDREHVKDAKQFIEHFVRYFLGAWERKLEDGLDGFNGIQKTAFAGQKLLECRKHVTPLIRRLRKGISLERGETKANRSRSRETRTSMEGKVVKEINVQDALEKIALCASKREYAQANDTYVKLTFGNKMWNLTFVAHVAACTMKGAREYRRNRDTLNTYDSDPVSQKYMHAMKKIAYFAQCIRPNDDHSKNVVI